MEIILTGENAVSIENLIKVFTERKPLKPFSQFCSSFDKGQYVIE